MAKYTDQDRTAALDAVDDLIAAGSSVTKACRQVGAERDIAVGTLKGWRAKLGRSEPVGDRTAAAAAAGEARVDKTNRALEDHRTAASDFRQRSVELLRADDQTAARMLTAATSAMGVIDKLVKLGRVEGAERTKSEVEVSLSPEQVKQMSDAEIAALLGERPSHRG